MNNQAVPSALNADMTINPAILHAKRFHAAGYVFDRQNGLGNVPDVDNIAYMGLLGLMRPTTFLSYVGDGLNPKTVSFIETEHPVLSTPFLMIRFDEETRRPTVVGHEGRARMTAIGKVAPDAAVPVALFLQEGYFPLRHRHLEPWMFEVIQEGLWSQPGIAPSEWIDGPPLLGLVYENARGELVALNYPERPSCGPAI